jgi:hypothetical protein
MAQFVAFDPNVEVRGETMLSTIASLGEQIRPVLAKHGLAVIEPEKWYPQQTWLDVLREVAAAKFNAMFDLVSIGMHIPENAAFPPDIDSIPAALASIDVAYHMNHRNGEIGEYRFVGVNDKQIDMICRNPYPDDFDYGIIYSMARRFRTAGSHFVVRHDDHAPCRKKGADSCTYHITWE